MKNCIYSRMLSSSKALTLFTLSRFRFVKQLHDRRKKKRIRLKKIVNNTWKRKQKPNNNIIWNSQEPLSPIEIIITHIPWPWDLLCSLTKLFYSSLRKYLMKFKTCSTWFPAEWNQQKKLLIDISFNRKIHFFYS